MPGYAEKLAEQPEILPQWSRAWEVWAKLRDHHVGGAAGMSSVVIYRSLPPSEVEAQLRVEGVAPDLFRDEFERVQAIGSAYVEVRIKEQASKGDATPDPSQIPPQSRQASGAIKW